MTDQRSARAERKRQETRARILAVAAEVFATHGYHGTGVTELVEAAGVARGTFYQYFDGKHAIFLELLDGLLARFRTSIVGVDVAAGEDSVHAQLVGIVQRLLHTAASHQALATIIFREAVGLDADVDDRLQAFEGELHAYLSAALRRGANLGWLSVDDPDTVATLVYGGLRQLIDRRIVRGHADLDSLDAAARVAVGHHLLGLLHREAP